MALVGSDTVAQPAQHGAKVSVDCVSLRFGHTDVLEDVSLEIAEGEFVSLLGPSGCGKTTLLNVIAGFLPPTAGQVVVDSKVVTSPGADRVMVFQDDAVFPWYTVRQNIEYGLRLAGVGRDERARQAEEMMHLVGLAGRETAWPRELSGGMRKRVDVGRALVVRPEVLLMDEPFAALDAMTKARLQSEFLQIWGRSGITVVFVSHDIEEALFMSDRIMLMATEPGRIAAELKVDFGRPRPDSLRTDPALQDLRSQLLEALRGVMKVAPAQQQMLET